MNRDAGMDWEQVRLNGGPPCFFKGADGPEELCGRARRWEGHGHHHDYVSLADLLATVEADALRLRNALEDRTRRIESLTTRNTTDWDGEGIVHLTDFMCVCNKESKKACDDLMARVSGDLGSDHMLSALVYKMAGGDHHASIDFIASDQWVMIGASVMKRRYDTGKYTPLATITVECDVVEHGLARVWELTNQAIADDLAYEALTSKVKGTL